MRKKTILMLSSIFLLTLLLILTLNLASAQYYSYGRNYDSHFSYNYEKYSEKSYSRTPYYNSYSYSRSRPVYSPVTYHVDWGPYPGDRYNRYQPRYAYRSNGYTTSSYSYGSYSSSRRVGYY